MRTFEEIAEAQGWDEHQQLELLRQYITNQDDEPALSDFAEDAAAREAEENPREKGDDDGMEYSDPRDERDERS
jgi:hypothetical protein